MGEVADMMLDGTLDSQTGEYIGEAIGYPRTLGDTKYKYNKRYPKRGVVMYLNRKFPDMPKSEQHAFAYAYVKANYVLDELNKNNQSWVFIAHIIQKEWHKFVEHCNQTINK